MLRKGAASVVARASPPLRRAGARQGRLLYAHHQSSSAFAFRQTWSFSRALHGTTASDLGSQPALETKIPDAGAADVIEAVADGTATGSSGVPVSMDLLELYRGLVAQGRLKWDDEQVRTVMQLRHLLETLEDYTPPLDLLAKLTPSAPYRARQIREEAGGKKGWWKGKGKEDADLFGDAGKELVKVLSGEEELANLKTPKGILITGPPGTGKSLLLSLFFSLVPTARKRRHHYHAFTLSLYQRVFQEMDRRRRSLTEAAKTEKMEKAAKKGWRAVFAGGRWDGEGGEEVRGWEGDEEAIPFIIARDMILEYHVLYFDELQLVDASSAALLRDVLSWYWRLGGVVVSCSNRVPDDLYYHGVQRERMAGFLEALKGRCEVVELDGGRDWRRGVTLPGEEGHEEAETRDSWFLAGSQGSKDAMEQAWRKALGGAQAAPTTVNVYGRKVQVPLASGSTCRFSFADLCEEPLGPADYITLASTFRTFFIDDVPVLYLKNKNEARRLINLVDALYESRCQVFITAQASPTTMFFPDALTGGIKDDDNESIMAAEALSETLHAPLRPNVSVYNPTTSAQQSRREAHEARQDPAGTSSFSVLSIFTGEDERFAYKRAVSRLVEMTTSPTYPSEEWIPVGKEGRRWELFEARDSPSTSRSLRARLYGGKHINEEFGSEAEFARAGVLTPKQPVAAHEEDDGGFAGAAEEGDRTRPRRPVSATASPAAPMPTWPRENPPVIHENHVWGVKEEWGPKAGQWGKGAKAFTGSQDGQDGKGGRKQDE